jgi:hypothetical protein
MLPGLIILEPMRELGKLLLVCGIALAVVGGFFFFGGRLPFRLGRLPGDIAYQGKKHCAHLDSMGYKFVPAVEFR